MTELMTNSQTLCVLRGRRVEARQKNVLLQVMSFDLLLERLLELAAPDDQEPRIRYLPQHQYCGLDQVSLAFVRHERRNVADDRCPMRQPELLVHIERRGRHDVPEIDAS